MMIFRALLLMIWAALAEASPFTIVIDAGSTGCRLYVYQLDPKGTLRGTTGPKVKPGLSTFKTHPSDLREFIKPLFIEAQNLIPQSEWASTPVHIKATAGMRLVTEEQARVIYDTVYTYLSSTPDVCPFAVDRSSLKTISGGDEGYFGALSANYLSGVINSKRELLHPHDAGAILGALDLGGSSTQVSLYLPSPGTSSVGNENFFVHSYLGFGVEKMAEKHAAHLAASGDKSDPCVPRGFKQDASGGPVGSGDFEACKASLVAALGIECPQREGQGARCVMDGVALPKVGGEAKFIGMSVYFFALRSLLATLKMARHQKEEVSKLSWPSPSVAELRQAGAAYCAIPWAEMEGYALADGWEPFAGDAEQRKRELPERCRQAAYIDLLLGSVYGVPTEAHNVMIALDIDNMEVEWTLGSVLALDEDAPLEGQGGRGDGDERSGLGSILLLVSVITLALVAWVVHNFMAKKARRAGNPYGAR
mmetsp:Transcript_49620/g.112657  ORF Transcript_49620/g.112657 Transcript_49620/m.112657 type:complete len:479 (-) Transcript_49620:270-1706(-)